MGLSKTFKSSLSSLYSFIKKKKRKKNRSMHIASSGEGINEITRILAKKWLLAVAIEKLHFCLCNSSLNFCLSTFAAMLQPLEKLEEEGAYSKQLFSDQQKKALPNAFLSLLIRIVFSNRSKKHQMVSIIFYFRFFCKFFSSL